MVDKSLGDAMQIIDAYWELRNLGVSTCEVEIEQTDKTDDITDVLSTLQASYQVIKAPAAMFDVYEILRKKGFVYVESSIRVSHLLKEISGPNVVIRLSNEVSFDEMNENDIGLMRSQIASGMFQTDRVALDPVFSNAQAANRYIMWMNDERERGSKFFNYKYKGNPVGFSCMREASPGIFYPVLGGVYNTKTALPIGSVIVYKQLEIARSLGGKSMYTYISSNNPAVVRIYSQLGYVFEDIKYVFIKHLFG